jgi:hypothetical protein
MGIPRAAAALIGGLNAELAEEYGPRYKEEVDLKYSETVSEEEAWLKPLSMDREEAKKYLQEVSGRNERMRRGFYERYEAAKRAEADLLTKGARN